MSFSSGQPNRSPPSSRVCSHLGTLTPRWPEFLLRPGHTTPNSLQPMSWSPLVLLASNTLLSAVHLFLHFNTDPHSVVCPCFFVLTPLKKALVLSTEASLPELLVVTVVLAKACSQVLCESWKQDVFIYIIKPADALLTIPVDTTHSFCRTGHK